LFRDKALVRHICYLIIFYTFLKTENYVYLNTSFLFEADEEIKSPVKGKVGDKEMTLPEVKNFFITLKNNLSLTIKNEKKDKDLDKEFCMLANGFWQAEGYIGGIFRSGINFYPICSATQLFSVECAEFLIRLDNALNNKGTFSITLNNLGKFVIAYRLSGWDTFFSIFVPYFYMLYGQKHQAILKLKKIFELKDYRVPSGDMIIIPGSARADYLKNNSDDVHKALLVRLVYSLTSYSSNYKVNREDKLISLEINPSILKELPTDNYKENEIKPHFLFILGFFLGDGTLHLKLEWKEKNSTVVILPLFNILQSNIESNKYIMELMTNTLNALDIKTSLEISSNTYTLTVKGINNVFNSLFPLLKKYSHLLYWKTDSFNLLMWADRLIRSGGHHTYFGLKALINKIYNNYNKRFTDKKVWMDRIDTWLNEVSGRREYGEYYISAIYTSNHPKQIRGWQVRFPSTVKLPNKSNKAFICSTYGGKDNALLAAVQYRDKILSDWIDQNFYPTSLGRGLIKYIL
jgi:hypothetical protein